VKYTTQNIYKISEPQLSHLSESEIIYSNERDAMSTSFTRGTVHTDQDTGKVENHIALKNTLYQRQGQQHAHIVENRTRLNTEAAKSIKQSYAQDFLHPDHQQVFALQILPD
jgi:hypothetical protein